MFAALIFTNNLLLINQSIDIDYLVYLLFLRPLIYVNFVLPCLDEIKMKSDI
ncbi:hypothetical protein Cha6605_1938 [Chamaesiphon minutus PCC 6605]|uniref:Uncharacterized protein n=1 Tax=Chamaesiphon minutus (strain ATCC 27169 / PCC 6605) TaxID=1173020 RepID=K9UDY1_CHAP6|nr:hypothetical protein Cha6605_1938 [Chamaesiphon minutus PCC 6605]